MPHMYLNASITNAWRAGVRRIADEPIDELVSLPIDEPIDEPYNHRDQFENDQRRIV